MLKNAMSTGESKWWTSPEPSAQRATISAMFSIGRPPGPGGTEPRVDGSSRRMSQLRGLAPAGQACAGIVTE